jgi:SOS response regulatory protein OraA/RecX
VASPFGSVPGVVIGVGVGTAAAAALEPVVEPARQAAWKANQNRLLDPRTMARLVAQGGVPLGDAHEVGSREGLSQEKIDALVYLEQHAPEIGMALRLLRRSKITPDQLHHSLAKAQLEPQYWPGVEDLQHERLGLADLARAIHRGLVPDPGLLQGHLPSGVGNVPAYPVYKIDALEEALADGYDHDRLGVQVGLQGLPMGPHEAAQGVFRKILTHDDFLRAIAEGNTRNEWADAILAQTRQIPTARDFVENALRGYRSLPVALEGAALHGMSEEHATMIYQNQGRPMAVRMITQALARGGDFKPEPGEIKDPYDASIVEGNLKPAYYDLAKAMRYSYSVPFWWRTLVSSGAIQAAEAEQLLLNLGNPPDLAHRITVHFAGATTTTAGKQETAATLRAEYEGYLLTEQELRTALAGLGYAGGEIDREVHLGDAGRVKSYRDKALEAAHKSYISAQLTSADVGTALAKLHIDATAVGELLAIWEIEKTLTRKTLTAAQIKAAYRRNTITQAEAISDLEEHGYSAADAQTYLAS